MRTPIGKDIPAQQPVRIHFHHHSQDILRFTEAGLLDKASTRFCSFMFPWPLAWFLDGTSPPISTPRLPRASCPSALLGWVPYYYSMPRHKSSAPRFHNLVKHFLDSFLKKKKTVFTIILIWTIAQLSSNRPNPRLANPRNCMARQR